jgi:hypothetical protein
MENSGFKIQDPGLRKSLREKQQITIIGQRDHGAGVGRKAVLG